jgi:hypothetical protein
MKYLLLLTLLVGYGQGQTTTGNPHDILTIQGPCNITEGQCDVLAAPTCDYTIEFHGKSKAIKYIFPEECGLKNTIIVDPPGANKLPAIYFTPGDDGPPDPENGKLIEVRDLSKVPDVPAVRISPKCAGGCVPPPAYWGCADDSRILLIAEDGKRWCHKPESSPKP